MKTTKMLRPGCCIVTACLVFATCMPAFAEDRDRRTAIDSINERQIMTFGSGQLITGFFNEQNQQNALQSTNNYNALEKDMAVKVAPQAMTEPDNLKWKDRGGGSIQAAASGTREGASGTATIIDSTQYNVDIGDGSARVINGVMHRFVGFGTERCYGTISSAMNAASAGDVIIVSGGTYNETVTMRDGVILMGGYRQDGTRDINASQAIVNGGFIARNIMLATEINGFAIEGGFSNVYDPAAGSSEQGYMTREEYAMGYLHYVGIMVNNCSGSLKILNNRIDLKRDENLIRRKRYPTGWHDQWAFSIYAINNSSAVISNNYIHNGVGGFRDNGILSWNSSLIIRDNKIYNNAAGIMSYNSRDMIENNIFWGYTGNSHYAGGIVSGMCSSTIRSNTFYNLPFGINFISNSYDIGLQLDISNNVFKGCQYAVYWLAPGLNAVDPGKAKMFAGHGNVVAGGVRILYEGSGEALASTADVGDIDPLAGKYGTVSGAGYNPDNITAKYGRLSFGQSGASAAASGTLSSSGLSSNLSYRERDRNGAGWGDTANAGSPLGDQVVAPLRPIDMESLAVSSDAGELQQGVRDTLSGATYANSRKAAAGDRAVADPAGRPTGMAREDLAENVESGLAELDAAQAAVEADITEASSQEFINTVYQITESMRGILEGSVDFKAMADLFDVFVRERDAVYGEYLNATETVYADLADDGRLDSLLPEGFLADPEDRLVKRKVLKLAIEKLRAKDESRLTEGDRKALETLESALRPVRDYYISLLREKVSFFIAKAKAAIPSGSQVSVKKDESATELFFSINQDE